MNFNIFKSGLIIVLAVLACQTNKSEDPRPSGTSDTSHPPAITVTTVAGTDTNSGYADGQGINSKFLYPAQMVFDKNNNLFVIDQKTGYWGGSMIRKISVSGEVTTLAKGFSSLMDICIDPRDGITLYAVQLGNNIDVPYGIFKVSASGEVTRLGPDEFLGGYEDGQLNTSKFSRPSGIAMDNAGNLFIADAGNYCVRKINLDTKMVTTQAGDADHPDAVCTFADGVGKAAQFCSFEDLTIDNEGNIFVPDKNNHRIRKITPDGTVSTLLKSGINEDLEGPLAKAYVWLPTLCYFDKPGNQLLLATSSGESLKLVTKNQEFYSLPKHIVKNDYAPGSTNSREYTGIAVNSKGEIFISDGSNHCIRKLTLAW